MTISCCCTMPTSRPLPPPMAPQASPEAAQPSVPRARSTQPAAADQAVAGAAALTTPHPAAPTPEAAAAPVPAAAAAASVAPPGELTPDQMQASHGGSAACGPAAAAAFSRFLGTDLSMDAAVKVAEDAGLWNENDGMGGYQSEVQLLGKLGIAAHATDSVDWDAVKKTVQGGTPVILATGKHYWVAEQYDAATGRFNFGKSGSVFKNEDRTWYTPKEMEDHGPAAQHAIFLDGKR